MKNYSNGCFSKICIIRVSTWDRDGIIMDWINWRVSGVEYYI